MRPGGWSSSSLIPFVVQVLVTVTCKAVIKMNQQVSTYVVVVLCSMFCIRSHSLNITHSSDSGSSVIIISSTNSTCKQSLHSSICLLPRPRAKTCFHVPIQKAAFKQMLKCAKIQQKMVIHSTCINRRLNLYPFSLHPMNKSNGNTASWLHLY